MKVLVIDDSLTILKVVHTILHLNGYYVHTARDGVEGFSILKSEGPFDLVLLDFVMPRMNGYQFCRKLRADPEHKDTPVVLMSARTSTIGDRFVQQTGALDALDKPFDARALVAVVQSVLGRNARRSMPDPAAMMDEEDLSEAPMSAPPPSRHFRSMNLVGTLVGQTVAPILASMNPQDLANTAIITDTIANAMTEEVIGQVARAMDEMDLRPDTGEALRGQLDKIAIAEFLQFMQLGRLSGVLKVRNKGQSVTLFVREGMLELAQSTGTDDEFRIGRYFVETNWLRREEVDNELVKARKANMLLGEHLLEAGHIDAEKLRQALSKQSAELVYELLRWPEGRFVLHYEDFNEEAEKANLELGLGELVFEGFRRVDEWRLMADTIDFDAVLVTNEAALGTLDDAKIGKSERKILMAIDGERTTREVMEATELASFDAIKAIYGFVQSRIVRERGKLGTTGANPALRSTDGEGTSKPQLTTPDGTRSTAGASKPGASKPGASKPGASKPGASKPGASKPSAEGSRPGAPRPRGSSSGKEDPKRTQPSAGNTKNAKGGAAEA